MVKISKFGFDHGDDHVLDLSGKAFNMVAYARVGIAAGDAFVMVVLYHRKVSQPRFKPHVFYDIQYAEVIHYTLVRVFYERYNLTVIFQGMGFDNLCKTIN